VKGMLTEETLCFRLQSDWEVPLVIRQIPMTRGNNPGPPRVTSSPTHL